MKLIDLSHPLEHRQQTKDWFELHHDILLPKEIVSVESLANLDKVPAQF